MLHCKEGSTIWEVMERTTKYLMLMYNLQLATELEIAFCDQLREYMDAISIFDLPGPVGKSRDEAKRILGSSR